MLLKRLVIDHMHSVYACLARVMKNEVLESPESRDSYEADNECQ